MNGKIIVGDATDDNNDGKNPPTKKTIKIASTK